MYSICCIEAGKKQRIPRKTVHNSWERVPFTISKRNVTHVTRNISLILTLVRIVFLFLFEICRFDSFFFFVRYEKFLNRNQVLIRFLRFKRDFRIGRNFHFHSFRKNFTRQFVFRIAFRQILRLYLEFSFRGEL